MKKIKRLLMWLAINSCLGFLLWSGFDQGVEGARNSAYFVLWLQIVISPILLADWSIESMRKEGPSLIPAPARTLVSLAIIAFLVWHGAWVTAAAYLFASVCQSAALLAASKPAKAIA